MHPPFEEEKNNKKQKKKTNEKDKRDRKTLGGGFVTHPKYPNRDPKGQSSRTKQKGETFHPIQTHKILRKQGSVLILLKGKQRHLQSPLRVAFCLMMCEEIVPLFVSDGRP